MIAPSWLYAPQPDDLASTLALHQLDAATGRHPVCGFFFGEEVLRGLEKNLSARFIIQQHSLFLALLQLATSHRLLALSYTMNSVIHMRLLFETTAVVRDRLAEYLHQHSPTVTLEHARTLHQLSPHTTQNHRVCTVIDCDQHDDWEMIESVVRSGGQHSATIIVSSDANLTLARRVFAMGAFDCLPKPVQADDFIDCISRATQFLMAQTSTTLDADKQAAIDSLTPRELEYFHKMMQGWSIKVLALHYQVSVQTAAKHRARVLAKLKVDNEVMLLHNYSGSL